MVGLQGLIVSDQSEGNLRPRGLRTYVHPLTKGYICRGEGDPLTYVQPWKLRVGSATPTSSLPPVSGLMALASSAKLNLHTQSGM